GPPRRPSLTLAFELVDDENPPRCPEWSAEAAQKSRHSDREARKIAGCSTLLVASATHPAWRSAFDQSNEKDQFQPSNPGQLRSARAVETEDCTRNKS